MSSCFIAIVMHIDLMPFSVYYRILHTFYIPFSFTVHFFTFEVRLGSITAESLMFICWVAIFFNLYVTYLRR